MAYKVFLSYRRDGGAEIARLIRSELQARGYEVFLDVEDIGAAFFDEELLREIERADHFIVILTPGALHGCCKLEDWFRREIAHALGTGRNVIPVLKDGFAFPPQEELPADIRDLARRNGVEYSHRFFRATIGDLVSFLGGPGADGYPTAVGLAAPGEGGRNSFRGPKISLGRVPVPTSGVLQGRDRDLESINAAWQDGRTTVVQIIADGGVGKTCLVWHWLERLRQGGFADVSQALDWSFYGQEQGEYTGASYDFLQRAVHHFEPYGLTLDEHQRKYPDLVGEAIGDTFERVGGVLVLDGVESLQHPPDIGSGALKDLGVGALLRQLRTARPSQATDPRRLAIITTRWPLPDLRGDSVLTINLPLLNEDDGARLLREFRDSEDPRRGLFVPSLADDVSGPFAEFRKAAKEYGGHPLALELLASCLIWRYDGDLLMRRNLPAVSGIPHDDPHRHARRVMQTYEHLFASNPSDALQRACRQVLWLIGLFERPAPASLLKSLRSGEPIGELTEGLTEELFKLAVRRLQQLHLITPDSTTSSELEAHPLIRDHFRQSLEEVLPAAAREAHGRVFVQLCQSAANPAETLEEAALLFEAVVHGCKAGRYRDALLGVYCQRLQRGEIFYASTYLGVFGQLLSVLSYFLDPVQPMDVVQGENQEQNVGITGSAYVMNQRSVMLRALNRPEPAEEAMAAARNMISCWNDTEKCAADTNNLIWLHLLRGRLSEAEEAIEWYAAFAESVGRGFKLKPDSVHYLRTEVLLSGWRCAVLHQRGKLLAACVLRDKMIEVDRKIFDGKCSEGLSLWAMNYHTSIQAHESDMTEGGLEIEEWPRCLERGDTEELINRLSSWGFAREGLQRGHRYKHTLQGSRHFIIYSLMVARALSAKARQEGFILTKGDVSYEGAHRRFLVNHYSAFGQMTWGNECQKEPLDYIDIAFGILPLVFYQDLVPQAFLARAEVCWGLRKLKPELTVEAAARRALSDVEKALDFATRGGWLLYQCDGWLARTIISLECLLETKGTSRESAVETIRAAAEDRARAADVVHGRHPWQSGDRDGYHRRDVDLLYLEALLARAEKRLAARDGSRQLERDKALRANDLLAAAVRQAEESGYRLRDLDLTRAADPIDEAKKLLLDAAGPRGVDKDNGAALEFLAREFAGKADALGFATSYFRAMGCSLAGYVAEYNSTSFDNAFGPHEEQGGAADSLARVLGVTLRTLSRQGDSALDVLQFSALLGADQVPVELVSEGGALDWPDLPKNDEGEPLQDLLLRLAEFGLLTISAQEGVFRLSGTVRDVIGSRVRRSNDFGDWASRVVRALERRFPPANFEHWETCRRLLPHAAAAALLVEQWSLGSPEALTLLSRLASFRCEYEGHLHVEQLLDVLIAIQERLLGATSIDLAETIDLRAQAFLQRHDFAAAERLSTRAVDIAGAVDHPHARRVLAAALTTLGAINSELGNSADAEVLSKRGVNLLEGLLGHKHPSVAKGLSTLGLVYCSQGHTDEAADCATKALGICNEVVAPTDRRLADSYFAMGLVSCHQQEFEKAGAYFKRALDIRENHFSPTHLGVGEAAYYMATVLLATGHPVEAFPFATRAYHLFRTVLGDRHPRVAASCETIARVYCKHWDYENADSYFDGAIDLWEKALGPDAEQLADILEEAAENKIKAYHAGCSYCESRRVPSRPEQAERLRKRAKELRERGPNSR